MSTFRKAYRQLTPEEATHMEQIKFRAEALEGTIMDVPAGRERAIALTKLEEAVMWAVKGLTG